MEGHLFPHTQQLSTPAPTIVDNGRAWTSPATYEPCGRGNRPGMSRILRARQSVAVLRTPPLETAPAQAQDLALATVITWMPRLPVDALALVVGELVSNAVQWARTSITVRLIVQPEGMRVEVIDDDPRPPLRVLPSTAAPHGLDLVAELSDRWGCERRGRGKAVWAELDLTGDLDTDLDDLDADLVAPGSRGDTL